jgi:LuxR family maltose regulon positive regulatory protein
MLEATAQDALGDPAAAGRAVERALDLTGPASALSAFLLYPAPGLLERHVRHSTRHAALISEILNLLPVRRGKAVVYEELASSRAQAGPAGSARTHIRHLFAKLGAHGRTEAVARARALSLLAPSGRTT